MDIMDNMTGHAIEEFLDKFKDGYHVPGLNCWDPVAEAHAEPVNQSIRQGISNTKNRRVRHAQTQVRRDTQNKFRVWRRRYNAWMKDTQGARPPMPPPHDVWYAGEYRRRGYHAIPNVGSGTEMSRYNRLTMEWNVMVVQARPPPMIAVGRRYGARVMSGNRENN